MGLNRIANICYGYLCLREEQLSIINNYNLKELQISVIIYLINDVSAETLTTRRMIHSGTNHLSRKALRCQMGYQKSYIEEGQPMQWPKEKKEKRDVYLLPFNILITSSFYYISKVLLIVTKANWLQLQRTGNVPLLSIF
jgi:hypothetical protein